MRELADRERRNLGPHPTPEQLADYHAEKLSAEEEERIQEHLALCPECAELFLDLVDFATPESGRDISGLTDEEVEAAWQEMRARLSGTAVAGKPPEAPEVRAPRAVPEPVPEPPPEPRAEVPAAPVVPLQRPERARPSRVYQSLAAMFLLTTLGAGFWALSLQHQLQDSQKPRAVTTRLSLEPGGSGTRSAEKPPAAGEVIRVTLHLDQLLDSPWYRVELRDQNGTLLWSEPAMPAPPNDGPLELVFSRGAGEYLFRVEGVGGPGAGAAADFLFQIDP